MIGVFFQPLLRCRKTMLQIIPIARFAKIIVPIGGQVLFNGLRSWKELKIINKYNKNVNYSNQFCIFIVRIGRGQQFIPCIQQPDQTLPFCLHFSEQIFGSNPGFGMGIQCQQSGESFFFIVETVDFLFK